MRIVCSYLFSVADWVRYVWNAFKNIKLLKIIYKFLNYASFYRVLKNMILIKFIIHPTYVSRNHNRNHNLEVSTE